MADDNTQTATGGDLHPGFNATPAPAPAAPAAPDRSQAENPRVRGHSPARDAREEQTTPQERMVRVRDSDYGEQAVVDALAHKAEQDVRKQSLPQSPNGYELKLPADFKAPEGVRFEFDKNDPGLARFQQLAHARGMDQKTFSDALGIYAANKISEQQRLAPARAAELSKLGSAAENRIGAVETWLKSRVGTKADLMIAQMRNYPVASMVETFEGLMRDFSNAGAQFDQRGRTVEEAKPSNIPAFTGNNFVAVRTAQTAEMLKNNPAMANRAGQNK